jgi:hypothetical protein
MLHLEQPTLRKKIPACSMRSLLWRFWIPSYCNIYHVSEELIADCKYSHKILMSACLVQHYFTLPIFYDMKIKFISQPGIIQKRECHQIHYWNFIVLYFRETTIMNWQSAICRKGVGEFKFPALACVLTAVLIQQQELIIAVRINICLNDSLIFI